MHLQQDEGRPSSSDAAPAPPNEETVPTLAGTGPKADNRHKFARTMLGLAPLPPAALETTGQPPAALETTGQPPAALETAGQPPAPSPEPARPPSESGELQPAKPGVRSGHKTMLGLAFNLPEPEPKNQATRTLVGAGEFAPPVQTAASVPFKDAARGTLMGVAVPGIAPVNPGVAKPEAPSPGNLPPPETFIASEPPASTPVLAPATSPPASRALLWAVSGLALALALVAVAAIWRWTAAPKLTVKVESDEAGHDALVIDCGNCDDTVSFSLGDVQSNVRHHQARLALRTPLRIGQNQVKVSMKRGSSGPDIIQLQVPVDFRVTGDTSGLDQTPAKLRLRIERTPAIQFEVDHTPVVFDASGKGLFELDISQELVGPSAQEQVLEKRISYQVRGPTGAYESALLLRAAVTPLVVTSPGSVLVTEGQDLRICGRTDPLARVEIAGLQTKVDKDGTFCNAAVIRELGRFEVWISAKRTGVAPRRVRISIERNANVREYAKALYPRVAHDVAQEPRRLAGEPLSLVALTGIVVEQSTPLDSARYLLKYDSAGAVNFARVNSFSGSSAKVGSRITVFGEPLGTLPGPDGRPMHELNAAFEVPALR